MHLSHRRFKVVLMALVSTLIIGIALSGVASALPPFKAPHTPTAKNVILLISDGQGYNHEAAASMYEFGRAGRAVQNRFPVEYGVSTYSTDGKGYDPESAWTDFDYVNNDATDSASSATAMATGLKTYDAAINVNTQKEPLTTIAQVAESLGKATGVVTSVEFSHATPAGFVAHNESRNNYEAIASEMIRDSATDVIMGGGHPWFDADGHERDTAGTYQYVGGQDTYEGLVDGTLAVADADGDDTPDPWTLVQTREEFQQLMTGDVADRVIGIAQVYQTLQQGRSGDGNAEPYEVPLTQTVPTLEEMTRGALNVLDNDPDGFFLMVEGGAVDWAAHANQSGRLIEEQIDFNRAVEAVTEWVRENSNWGETLVIVTADHETGYLTAPDSPASQPLVNKGVGKVPGMQWHSEEHTNSLIPLYAKGAGSNLFSDYADEFDPVRGLYVDDTDIFKVMAKVMK